MESPGSNLCPSLGSPPQANISLLLLQRSMFTIKYLPLGETLTLMWHNHLREPCREGLVWPLPSVCQHHRDAHSIPCSAQPQIQLTLQLLSISPALFFFFKLSGAFAVKWAGLGQQQCQHHPIRLCRLIFHICKFGSGSCPPHSWLRLSWLQPISRPLSLLNTFFFPGLL